MFFPYEWFDAYKYLELKELPSINSFYSKLKNGNVLGMDFDEYTRLLGNGKGSTKALQVMKNDKIPNTKEENYRMLVDIWEEQKTGWFHLHGKWYNYKDVVPTLVALNKMIQFHHNIKIDMLKLGLTLPSLANRNLHSTTTAKFFPFERKGQAV